MTDFTCQQLEQALRDEGALLEAARRHAKDCAACRAELEHWDSVSTAALELHREWESPGLWERIQERVSMETQPKTSFWQVWRLAFGALAVVLVSISVLWTIHHPSPDTPIGRQFLTERALAEVEASEEKYRESIDKLSKLAGPALEQASSPLIDSYREKLTLLDSAIAELRIEARRNALNASLRTELVNLYQQKQKTLTEVLRYANDASTPR